MQVVSACYQPVRSWVWYARAGKGGLFEKAGWGNGVGCWRFDRCLGVKTCESLILWCFGMGLSNCIRKLYFLLGRSLALKPGRSVLTLNLRLIRLTYWWIEVLQLSLHLCLSTFYLISEYCGLLNSKLKHSHTQSDQIQTAFLYQCTGLYNVS